MFSPAILAVHLIVPRSNLPRLRFPPRDHSGTAREEYQDAIQRQHRSNIIDVTIQTPPEGNRWLNTTALFTIAEPIGPERLRTATIEDLPESLIERIFHLWNLLASPFSPFAYLVLMVNITISTIVPPYTMSWNNSAQTGILSNIGLLACLRCHSMRA